ncbi:MAG: hypothetical protein V1744_08735 [Candidatus Altiarchaeota archaeon]
MTEFTAKELFLKVKHMDAETQDALTRFYLRLLKEETWSYQLKKENMLLREQSQEAYRKKLNKFVRMGFLSKGKRYYVDGKPRNPFKANLDVIKAIVDRYSFTKYETEAALLSFKELTKKPAWISSLDEKLHSKERLKFLDTLFPLVFMGREISRYFFKLLFISFSRTTPQLNKDDKYKAVHSLLMDMLNNIELSISYDGIDYVGKRLFLDLYVKDVMMLLYAMGAVEKHSDTMKVAILEDVTIPLLTPVKHPNAPEKEYKRFVSMSPAGRFDEIVKNIGAVKDHLVKEYYGESWEQELASYVAYAITSSIENPRDDIQGLLRHIQDKYSVTRENVETVAVEIQKKIDRHDSRNNPLVP